jgi:hypothetical protein
VNGRYVIVGPDLVTGDTTIASSIDGRTWTLHPLPSDESGARWALSFDAFGFEGDTIAVAGFEVLPAPELRLTKNGVTMIFDAGLNDMQFIDEASGLEIAGAENGERYGPLRLDEGNGDGNRVLSVLDDAGEVRAQFSLEEATAAMRATPGLPPRIAVYVTSDLRSWSRVILSEVTGQSNVTLSDVDVVDRRVIISVSTDRDGDPITPETDRTLILGSLGD